MIGLKIITFRPDMILIAIHVNSIDITLTSLKGVFFALYCQFFNNY